MFYETYETLCNKANKRPYAVARELGLGNSNVAQWKKGSTPRPELLQKIADYFGVTTGYLIGYEQQKKPILPKEDGPSPDDIQNMLEHMSPDQLLDVIAKATAIAQRKGGGEA